MTPEGIKVISFDMDGTLVEPEYSEWVWGMGIPQLFAERRGISFDEAKKIVEEEYRKIGDGSLQWYDIKYWFNFFQLDGNWKQLMNRFSHRIKIYPEVSKVLQDLFSDYRLIIISNAAREFVDIEVEVAALRGYFSRIFSATSDFGQIKKTAEFYGHICRLLGIRSTEMVHVGDHWEFDYLVPKSLGIKALHIDRSWSRSGDDVIRNLEEVGHRLGLRR
ncbi:MAG: HAD family hydrolase [Syntrophobacterales bacterium]|nr:MAG: HAD family hydrolase [Syntrophobacterales bacterium]